MKKTDAMLPSVNRLRACTERHGLICLIYFIFAMSLTWVIFKDGFETYPFAFEYGNIAGSLASGYGFAGVFENNEVATAWAPPFYVFVHFLIFKIFGIKTVEAMWAGLILMVLLLTWTLHLLLKLDYSAVLNPFKILLLPIFTVLSSLTLLYGFGDVTLNVLLSVVVLYLVLKIQQEGFAAYRFQALLLSIILPLSNLFLVIIVGILIISNLVPFALRRTHFVPVKFSFLIVAVMLGTVTVWGVRNYYSLGRFIPFKSNLWFELYLSNVKDWDGILKQSSWYAYHPLVNHRAQQSYNALGELAFLEPYKDSSLRYLRNDTGDFLVKVGRRALNSFLFMSQSNDVIEFDNNKISERDVRFLEQKKLVVYSYWTCLEMTPRRFREVVGGMNLTNPGTVISDWNEKKSMLKRNILHSPSNIIAALMVTFIPFISLVICCINKKVRSTPLFRFTVLFLLCSLGPYILIAHYFRYQSFQIGFFAILIFMSLEIVLRKFSTVR